MLNPKYQQKGLTATSIFDFPCTDEMAKALEVRQKELEKDGLGFKRVFKSATPEFTEGEMADISIITDMSLDKDYEAIDPRGCDFDSYFKSNPVVTLSHNYADLPVGRAAWYKAIPNKRTAQHWKAKTIYAGRPNGYPEQASWKPQEVYELVKGGFLQGKSIGFLAEEAREVSQKDIDFNPALQKAKRIFSKVIVFEYAVATVPSNGNALVEAVSKGLIRKGLLDEMGIELPETIHCEDVFMWEDAPVPSQKKSEIPMPRHARSWKSIQAKMVADMASADEIMARLKGKP